MSHPRHLRAPLAAAALLGLAASAALAADANAPKNNLEYWLQQSSPVQAEPNGPRATTDPAPPAPEPATSPDAFKPADALPGVIELSNGKQIPGWMNTTRDRPWMIWVEDTKRWHRVPFVCVLSITAEVVEEKMEQRWRWKEMGAPERVFTGKEFPTRILKWRFRLIDGSEITGDVKGQPIWVQLAGTRAGPFILHERLKGEDDQKLSDLVNVRKIVISRKAMDKVVLARQKEFAAEPNQPGK